MHAARARAVARICTIVLSSLLYKPNKLSLGLPWVFKSTRGQEYPVSMTHYTRYWYCARYCAPVDRATLRFLLLLRTRRWFGILNTEVRCAVRKWLRVSTLALML